MSVLEKPDEAAWLEWRRGGITATDVADAANGTYGGPYGVVARKLGLVTVEQTAQMQRGHDWQPRIADAVHVLTGRHVVGEEAWCEMDGDPMVRATVDGFLADFPDATPDDLLGVVEVKTRGRGTRPNRARWFDQMQWQMLATGMPAGLLAEAVIDDATDSCDSIHLTELAADPVRQEHLRGVARRLWDHIEAGTLPDPDDSSALDVVKAVWHDADPDAEPVDLADLEADIERLVRIRDSVKLVTDERDFLEAKIRNTIGEAVGGYAPRFKVTVSNPAKVLTTAAELELCAAHPEYVKPTLDRSAFKKDHKDIYDAATQAVGARRLTIKEVS